MSLDIRLNAVRPVEVYSSNITHNLTKMADAAGIYQQVWRPEELGIKTAGEMIKPLAEGIIRLRKDPEHFKTFNPANGWGEYHGFVAWLEEYLMACINNPDAEITVSR